MDDAREGRLDEFEKQLLQRDAALKDGEREAAQKDSAMRGWKFSREISLGNVLTISMLVITAMSAWSSLNTRTSVLEDRVLTQSATQRATDERQDAEGERRTAQMQAELARINGKLDRLIEGRRGNQGG